jgi:hypothetical protein
MDDDVDLVRGSELGVGHQAAAHGTHGPAERLGTGEAQAPRPAQVLENRSDDARVERRSHAPPDSCCPARPFELRPCRSNDGVIEGDERLANRVVDAMLVKGIGLPRDEAGIGQHVQRMRESSGGAAHPSRDAG